MWVRPLLTPGQWGVYTALWSYPTDSVFPTHQDLANRAWCERGTAADAVKVFDDLGLLKRDPDEREDGGQSANTYYLIEVPTAAHIKLLKEKAAEREVVQRAKQKKRKATNRKYEKPQATKAEETDLGGTVGNVPPGYDQDDTPGGTAQNEPQGSGGERTHKSLGLSLGVPVPGRSTSSPTTATTPATDQPNTAEADERTDQENPEIDLSPNPEHQEDFVETAEYVKSDAHYPELTRDEQATVERLAAAQPRWSARSLRKVIGSARIREIAGRDPELVLRAFLIGARDLNTVPMRLWHERCPHWAEAAAELASERSPQKPAPEAKPAPVKHVRFLEQRGTADTAIPALEHPAYLEWKAQNEAKRAERKRQEDAEEAERARRRAEVLAEAGMQWSR